MAELVILRGWPGSGKSTRARQEFPNHAHFEADMWMVDADGNYAFDPKRLGFCHYKCKQAVRESLEAGRNTVVANTFRAMWELKEYLTLPYDSIQILQCTGEYNNVHNCPQEKVEWMKDNWEKLKLTTTTDW